jgi:hypothetical protein
MFYLINFKIQEKNQQWENEQNEQNKQNKQNKNESWICQHHLWSWKAK